MLYAPRKDYPSGDAYQDTTIATAHFMVRRYTKMQRCS